MLPTTRLAVSDLLLPSLQAISINEGGEQGLKREIKTQDDVEQADVHLVVAHQSPPRPPLPYPPHDVHMNPIAPAATIMHLVFRDVAAPIIAACASISNA